MAASVSRRQIPPSCTSQAEHLPSSENLNTLDSSPTSYLNLVLEQQGNFGMTPLGLLCFHKDRSSFAKLLLEYSAEVNGTGKGNGCPLVIATQCNAHRTIDLLLEKKARLDVKDPEAQGVLHLAAALGDHQTIAILQRYEKQIREHCGIEDKDIHGHTPLEVFDMQRPSYVTEDEGTRLRTRAAFISLLGLELEEPTDISEKLVQRIQDLDIKDEISEKPRETSEEISLQIAHDLDSSDESEIFFDVEQEPEGPI